MPDVVTPAVRSRMMSGIRGANTKPEIQVRRLLHAAGYRFRIHVRSMPGKPDIVLPKYHAVILVDGCFWHGHDCQLFKWPSTRQDWWRNKIETTQVTDQRNITALNALGYRVCRVWECALKGAGRLGEQEVVARLSTWLNQSDAENMVIRGTR